ncbi:TlpA family protein disulfide reductase [Luteipulveratus flavus]|uniref:TlpA disulfide reductase family protein n=1 Tax=Luteipulveratus flavus TaxID=3031728 RepID=A0ABT6C4Z1_9MICO|nr:TlpA disulfide reductase family protein [Luteipulveratus sp. YIM 133296]MDF8263945.1 TlpA disulfide reductase family protein [Luteipulveratus sp. YIM 133296]
MSLLTGAVVLLAMACVANLLLLVAVLRRLREHQERLDAVRPIGDTDETELAPGQQIGGFTATTTSGDEVDQQSAVAGTTYVGFFSPTCPPCHEQLPLFLERLPQDARTLAVVLDDGDSPQERAEMVTRLKARTPVVIARPGDEIVQAFGVSAYPAMFVLDGDGVVQAGGHTVASLPRLQAV